MGVGGGGPSAVRMGKVPGLSRHEGPLRTYTKIGKLAMRRAHLSISVGATESDHN